jgi:hypothetical protein
MLNDGDLSMFDQMPMELCEGPEALEWLRQNKNFSALASNRFGPTEEAIKFVEEIYALGAEKIIIAQHCIRDDEETIKGEDGPYADGLTLFLPRDLPARKALLERCYQEALYEGFEDKRFNSDSYNEDFVFLWWD